MRMWRKIHGYVALAVTLPLILIAVTGIILQLRNQFEFIQPSVVKNEISTTTPYLSLEAVVEKFGKNNVEQVIFRPGKGALAVRLSDGYEVQIHPQTGEVIKKAMRRTGFLIDLHQGSFFGKFGQYGIFFITALGLFFLIVSGIIIYPFKRKKFI